MPDRHRKAVRIFCALLVVVAAGCSRSHHDPFANIFSEVRPSVALITTHVPANDPKRPGAWDEQYGSAVLVASSPDASYLLTDAHVVHEARDINVTLGSRTLGRASVIALDAQNDLVLLRISIGSLPTVPFEPSAELAPGDMIGVAGYPIPDEFQDEHLGLATSVYSGRIASMRHDALELDIPIIPGESGGPVFDARDGSIVGIVESRFDDERAIGFAIPSEIASKFVHKTLVRTQSVRIGKNF